MSLELMKSTSSFGTKVLNSRSGGVSLSGIVTHILDKVELAFMIIYGISTFIFSGLLKTLCLISDLRPFPLFLGLILN
jgi:hypothetical protein